MVDVESKFGIKAQLDTTAIDSGKGKIGSFFDGLIRKGKETTTFFSRLIPYVGGLVGAFTALGAVGLAAFTGLLAMSPHFKQFLLTLKKPFMDLSRFLGSKFQPILQHISSWLQSFVNWFTTSPSVNKWIDRIVNGLETLMDWIDDTVVPRVKEFFKTWEDEGFGQAIKDVWNDAWAFIDKKLEEWDVWGKVSYAWNVVIREVKALFSSVLESVSTRLYNTFVEFYNNVVNSSFILKRLLNELSPKYDFSDTRSEPYTNKVDYLFKPEYQKQDVEIKFRVFNESTQTENIYAFDPNKHFELKNNTIEYV